MKKAFLLAGFCALCLCPAQAWDYEGHRLVNELALASLPKDFPAFVSTTAAQERIAFLAGECHLYHGSDGTFRRRRLATAAHDRSFQRLDRREPGALHDDEQVSRLGRRRLYLQGERGG